MSKTLPHLTLNSNQASQVVTKTQVNKKLFLEDKEYNSLQHENQTCVGVWYVDDTTRRPLLRNHS